MRAAIVTCGGLCPGLNNIIKDITLSLLNLYGAAAVFGVCGGYRGFDGSPLSTELPKLRRGRVVVGEATAGRT